MQGLSPPTTAPISEKKVYRLCEAGDLIHHRAGRAIRIQPEAIDRYVRQSLDDVEEADDFDLDDDFD